MPLDVNIDDNNTTLIQYQGTWTYRAGSTRQWEGGVHATGQAGASATFNFRGYQIWVLGTIPAGSGTNVITVSIDGETASDISRTSNGSAVYSEVYFASPLLRDTSHTIVVTNRGSTTSGNSEFMFDRFDFQTDDEVPTFPAFTSATSVSSSASSSGTRTSSYVSHSSSSASRTSLPSSLRSPFSSAMPDSIMPLVSSTFVGSRPSESPSDNLPRGSSSTIPWGGVIGGIVSCLLVMIMILLFVLWRKRRLSTPSKDIPDSPPVSPLTPFPTASELPTPDTSNRPTLLSEKSSIQQQYQLDIESNASTTLTISPSSVAASGPSPLQSTSAGPSFVEPVANLNGNYDFPPPSYQRDPTTS